MDIWAIVAKKLIRGRNALDIARDAASLVMAGVRPSSVVPMWDAVDAAMMSARGIDELCCKERYSLTFDVDSMTPALLIACGGCALETRSQDAVVSDNCPVRRSVAYRLCDLAKVSMRRVEARDGPGTDPVPLLEVESRRPPPLHLKDVDALFDRYGIVRPVHVREEWDAKEYVTRILLSKRGLPERAALWRKIRYCTDIVSVIEKVAAIIEELGVDATELFDRDLDNPKWPNPCPVWSALRARALESGCDEGLPLIFDMEDIHAARRKDPGRPRIVTPSSEKVRYAEFVLRAVALDTACHDGDSNCDMIREDDGVRTEPLWLWNSDRIRLWNEDDVYVDHACRTCEHIRGRGKPMRAIVEQFVVPYDHDRPCPASRIARKCTGADHNGGESYYNRHYSEDGQVEHSGDSHYFYEDLAVINEAVASRVRAAVARAGPDETCQAMMAFLDRYVGAPNVRVEYVHQWDN